ncbi:MAG: hypothetical protein SGILL_008275 [Bacillariaceae sp.]
MDHRQHSSYSDEAQAQPPSSTLPMEFSDVPFEDDDDEMEETTTVTTTHDQLPTVEEIKAKVFLDREHQQGTSDYEKQRQRRTMTWVAVIALCLISVIGLFVMGAKRHNQSVAITAVTQTVRISSPDAFQDADSPQSKALHWMLHQDPLQLPLPTQFSDPFVQRYIVAVLVYSVQPPSMTEARKEFSFLTDKHECLWNSDWKSLSDYDKDESATTTLGVVCEDIPSEEDENEPVDGHDEDEGQRLIVTSILLPSAGLQGDLPPELESLTSLQHLSMNNNQIKGSLPVIPSLRFLNLAHNVLTGYLPDIFSEMTRLETLSMSENVLQGSLPSSFAALTNLKILAMNGNQLTGGMAEIYQLTNLEELYLSYNSFEDHLSNGSFHTLLNLKVLDMKNNRLAGPLPDALWNMTKLEVVDFHHNALDGHINNVIIPNHPLKYLDVSSNILGGGLPPTTSNLRHLTHLDVSYNRFNLVLPDYLANLTKMQTLMLTENDMFGPKPLPSWIRGMTDLQHLSFRLTSRTGTLPTWFGELTKLELLDLDWNHISGTIPSELGNLKRLKFFMLNRNLMNGNIPTEVSSLPNLKMLMVDNNGFSGQLDACQVTNLVADCGDPDIGCPDCNSDTQRIACPCCTSCCYANAQRCNMQDWNVEIDDEYRGDYGQYGYSFDGVTYVAA